MAIAAGLALLSTGAGVIAGGAASLGFATIFGATTSLGMMASHFLVTTAIGAAINALSPRPSRGSAASGYKVTASGSTLDHQIIYGKTKVAGARIFDESTGESNKHLHRVIVFAGHEIEEFSEIYFNDEKLTLDSEGNVTSPQKYVDHVRIKEHLGSPNQVADSDLVSEVPSWTTSHTLNDTAYLYIRFSFNADAFPNGIPEVACVIKGKKVFDPRSNNTMWSDNPALCLRDYLSNKKYGLGESSLNIDDTLISKAADVCQYYDYPTLTGNSRYTCNGAFLTSATPHDFLYSILSSMGGMLWYAQGKWRVKPAYWVAPVMDLTADDMRSSLSVSPRHSRRDNFNVVSGVFRGEESNWVETDFPRVTNQAFIDSDKGEENVADLRLPFTSSSTEARRIANIYLERNRQQITVSGSFGLRAFKLQVGDNITLTYPRFGWDKKEFEVVSWAFGFVDDLDLQVNLTLRETSENVFDDISDGIIYENDNTTLLSPFEVPSLGLSASARLLVIKEKLTNIVSVVVSSNSPERVDLVETQFKKTSETVWKSLGTGELGVFEAVDLEDGLYDFRARARNTFGNIGEWHTLPSIEATGLALPPSNISNAGVTVNGSNLNIEWSAVPDLDLSYYKIRHAVETTGATWGNSTTAIEKVPRPATSVTLPARSGTFMIRPYDKSGVTSASYSSLVVNSNNLVSYTTTQTKDDTSFSGTKTGCSISGGNLVITNTSSSESEATYIFSSYVDVGSPRLVRSRIDASVIRLNTSGSNFDDLSGLFDNITGMFDDLSGDQDFDDTDLEFYISTTTDNPASSTTWSAYQKFRVGDFYGRGFRFKVVLKSKSINVTPAISSLIAYVEYNT